MAWIEFHGAKIKRLKKFSDFRRSLQWSVNEALGFLGSFWSEVIELCESGDITGWTPEYICELTGVTMDPERVWNALVTYNWIDESSDGRLLIHDWLDYTSLYLIRRYASSNKGKLNEIWGLHGRQYGEQIVNEAKIVRKQKDNLPNLTLPNLTNQTYISKFEDFWKIVPARNGKRLDREGTLKKFCQLPENELDSCIQAVKNYSESELIKKGIGVKDPIRFLWDGKGNKWYWKEWIEPEETQHGGKKYL